MKRSKQTGSDDVLEKFEAISFEAFEDLPARSTTVLTVNNRLARSLLARLAKGLGEHSGVAEIPQIMPWSSWLPWLLKQASFEVLDALPTVELDSFACQVLWTEVIREIEAGEASLLDANQAAQSALDADMLIDEWRLQVNPDASTEEYERFAMWRDAYRQRLHALDALDANTTIERVLVLLAGGHIRLPQHLVLFGFSEFSPRMLRLLQTLANQGVSVARLPASSHIPAVPQSVALASPQDEWQAAAYWAKQSLARFPAQRFAIIAVNLQADVVHARRILDDVLATDAGEGAYNVAIGRSLAEWPMGRALLAWLRTFLLLSGDGRAAPKDLAQALLAGYCAGDQSELSARAMIDASWRSKDIAVVTLAEWSRALSGLKQLGPSWQMAFQHWQTEGLQADCARWTERFKYCLAALGFPGGQTQSTTEYQVSEALDQMFRRFSNMSPVLGNIEASTALKWLDRLARSIVFQPQALAQARLDVLGLLEAEGGRWDGVWMLGMSDDVIPAAPQPNPFIPVEALQRGGAPRATALRELEWANKLYEQLLCTAATVIVSVARHDGERELRASPLIVNATPVSDQWSSLRPAFAQIELENFEGDSAPSVSEQEEIKGGTSLLETQAKNPLWAFWRYRLHTEGLKPHAVLPPSTLRGKFIHRVLERFWKDIPDQASLIALIDKNELIARLQTIAQNAAQSELAAFSDALRQLEIERDVPLIADWLSVEAGRHPFTVKEVETDQILDFGVFKLGLKIDRLDQLEGNAAVVLDYKSSGNLKNIVKDWSHPRPVNLQLPAYVSVLLARPQPLEIAALMLVQIHARQDHGQTTNKTVKGVAGLAQFAIGLEGLELFADQSLLNAENWPDLLRNLEKSVRDLGKEFAEGVVVNESWRRDDLTYCDVKPLLRLFDDIQEEAIDE